MNKGSGVRVVFSLAFLSIASACLLVGQFVPRTIWAEDYQRFESVKVGMSEQQVKDLLGDPDFYYEEATAPENYYVDGYSFHKKPLEHAVMIYVGVEPIAYYYLDESGEVDDIYIGGS